MVKAEFYTRLAFYRDGREDVEDAFNEAAQLLKDGKPREGMKILLTAWKQYATHEFVDEEIQVMEDQYRLVFPETSDTEPKTS